MKSNIDQYKKDLKILIALGDKMSLDLSLRAMEDGGRLDDESREIRNKIHGEFEKNYQKWYTESCALIRQMAPERLSEFENLYKGDSRRKDVNLMTYTIQDWLMRIRASKDIVTGEKAFNDLAAAAMRFQIQLEILKSVEARFESSLFEIKQLVQADLFDSELDGARELLKNGYLRAAGVIAGVVLESHLSQVLTNYGIKIRKKNPSISDYNGLLKTNNVIDVPQWRFIQRLGDIRNLCGHKKQRDPTKDEVSELIDGVEKIIKTLY